MVDSIRRTHRIGVIKPAGQRRTVEQRHQPRKERHHQSGDDSHGAQEESATVKTENQACVQPEEDAQKSAGPEDTPPTGGRIDVRI